MTVRHALALCLGACLFAVGPAALADDESDDANVQAMKMRIDEKTGNKINAEDDSNTSAKVAVGPVVDSGRNSNVSAMMPAKSQPAQYKSNGSMTAKVGFDRMKFLVAKKGEDGELSISHQAADQVDINKSAEHAKGEE